MRLAMAAVALGVLIAFLGILIWHVPSPDLIAVVVVVTGFAAYDFATSLFKSKG